MRRLRTASTRRLLTILACAGVLVMSATIAQAALTGAGPVAAPKALAQAIRDAIGAPAADGVTARISFTNNLLPGAALPGASSALTSGADGRLWLAKDGRLRLELQSGSGDVQITFDDEQVTFSDASSNTVYRAKLPAASAGARKREHAHEPPTVARIQDALDRLAEFWTVSEADPTRPAAGRAAYTVRIAPKDGGGLLGAAEVAWDALTGVPLRAAVYAKGRAEPVLELRATDISYGAVSSTDVAPRSPAGARIVDLSPEHTKAGAPRTGDKAGAPRTGHERHGPAVRGADAVARRLSFPLAAPRGLAGLPRRSVRLVSLDGRKGALVTYGRGLGAIAVFQHERDRKRAAPKASGHRGRHQDPLPQFDAGGATATEIATALGTIVTFDRGGVSYILAGSVSPAVAKDAARGLR